MFRAFREFKEGFKRGWKRGMENGMDREDRIGLAWLFAMFAALWGVVLFFVFPLFGLEPPRLFYIIGVVVFMFGAIYHFWHWIKDFE